MIDHYAGAQLAPDEHYNPYEESTNKDLTDGIWPEFQGQFAQATSAGQAAWMKQSILQKQKDLGDLSTLGTKGNIGRFAAGMAFGMVDPINVAAMVASGGTSMLLKATATAARTAEGVAVAAEAASRMRPIASGLATAGGLGAATEKLRQNYNFEDDNMGVLTAGLTSMAFAAPFVGLHAHEQAKVSQTAMQEAHAIEAMRKQQAGEPLAPHEEANLHAYTENLQKAMDVEAGRAEQAHEASAPDTHMTKDGRSFTVAYNPETYAHEARDSEGNLIGALDVESDQAAAAAGGEPAVVSYSNVEPEWRGQGVGAKLYDSFHDMSGGNITPANTSPEAFNVWINKFPEQTERYIRRDAEGLVKKLASGDFDPALREASIKGHDEQHPIIGEAFRKALAEVEGGDKWEGMGTAGKTKAPAYENPVDREVFGMADSVGAARVDPNERIASLADQPTAMTHLGKVPIRWDFYTHFNKSDNPVFRFLGNKLVKDAIGNDAHEAQGWTASELKSQYRRTLEGNFHLEARRAFDEAAKVRGMNFFKKAAAQDQFYSDISRVVRGDTEVLKANPDIAPQLEKAAKAQKDFYVEMRRRMEAAGVEGAEYIPDNPQYVNRVWKQDNIREAFAKHKEQMYEAVGRAIKLDGVTGGAATAKAKGFMDAVMKLEFSHAMQDIHLYAKDMVTLREELANSGLKDHEINSLVDLMFDRRGSGEGDAGQAGPLKYRLALNENHAERMADGSVFRISDLFENDSRLLAGRYMNSMGGHLALAEVGIKSRAQFMAKMREAEQYHGENAMTSGSGKYNRVKQMMQDVYDNITGRPMSTQSFNRGDRVLGAMRAWTRSAMLGQLGIPAALEMKNAIGLTSMRAFTQHMPTFGKIIRSMQAGHPPPEGLEAAIHHLTGHGLEHVSAYARQHEITDFSYDKGLTRFENFSGKLSHAVDHISGNSSATAATRMMSARMAIQKHIDFAMGKTEMTAKQRERMTHNGVGTDDQPDVHGALKKYTEMDGNKVDNVDYEKWSREAPETYSKFQLLLSREVRDMIQDHDLGETIPFMHTTVGKIFSELKTFVLVGHAKQFLKSLHYRDSTTAVQWMYSFAGAALEYSLQNSINYAHDPDKLAQRLSPSAIALGAVSRMAVLGLMPQVMDTAYQPLSGGQSLFANGTANTDNRNIFLTPSMIEGARLATLAQVTGSVVNPFSTNTITQKEMHDALGAIPGGNLYIMRNVNDMIGSHFPKFKPRPTE
jgi:GNAT superfamily N-acetyltransferase